MDSNSASTKTSGSRAKKRSFTVCLVLAVGVGLSQAVPAQAYNWAYNPVYWGLSSMRYLFPVFGAPYNANPMYSVASICRTVGRGATMLPPYRYPYQQLEQYQDEEPIGDPRDRVRPYRSGPDGVDEISYSGWRPSTGPQAQLGSVSQPLYPGYSGNQGQLMQAPPGYTLQPLPQQAMAPQTAPRVAAAPQVAPQFAGVPPQAYMQQPAQPIVIGEQVSAKLEPPGYANNPHLLSPAPTPLPGSPAPLAAAFINHVNTKFGGNISEALFDAETRSWARVLGLVNHDDMFHADLTEDRIHVIAKIFHDPHLDPLSKLDATRILLRKQNESIQIADKGSKKRKKNK